MSKLNNLEERVSRLEAKLYALYTVFFLDRDWDLSLSESGYKKLREEYEYIIANFHGKAP